MKKLTVLLIMGFMLGFGTLSACIIEMTPAKSEVAIGEKVPVTVVLKYEHRRCVLELTDTQFKPSGLTIEEKGEWETLGSGVYRLKMNVVIKGSPASLAVIRECDKKGVSEEVLKFRTK